MCGWEWIHSQFSKLSLLRKLALLIQKLKLSLTFLEGLLLLMGVAKNELASVEALVLKE